MNNDNNNNDDNDRTPAPTGTPSPTPLNLDLEPTSTPRIVIESPMLDETPPPARLDSTPAAQATSPKGWAFFVVGFILGALVGRMSWGLKRRKRQQLFG